jgi:hypothetical protein
MRVSLLDPSCSGSGIVNRLDHLTEQGMSHNFFSLAGCGSNGATDKEDGDGPSKQERLEKLAAFQLMMIEHAMKCKWPRSHLLQASTSVPVHSGTFSTCYVHGLRVAVLHISGVAAGMSFLLDVSACNERPMPLCCFPWIRVSLLRSPLLAFGGTL